MRRRIFLGLLSLPFLLGAGDTALDRSTLRGLKALNVAVDGLDPELESVGLGREMLRARLMRRMESAGIRVDANAPEFVGVHIMHVRDRRGPYAICLTLSVYQPVTLVRDREVKTATPTWGVQTVLMSDRKVAGEAVLRAADELLDGLVTAYKSVNPGAGLKSP